MGNKHDKADPTNGDQYLQYIKAIDIAILLWLTGSQARYAGLESSFQLHLRFSSLAEVFLSSNRLGDVCPPLTIGLQRALDSTVSLACPFSIMNGLIVGNFAQSLTFFTDGRDRQSAHPCWMRFADVWTVS